MHPNTQRVTAALRAGGAPLLIMTSGAHRVDTAEVAELVRSTGGTPTDVA